MAVTNISSPTDKASLFRSLFARRTDVYPRCYETREGRSGYSPVCANEWTPGLCGKPKSKCQSCPARKLLPVTDEVIRFHLSGFDGRGKSFVAGVYPMLLDELACFWP